MCVLCQILDLLEHKAVFTSGYKAILHLHSLVEECEITTLFHQIDMKVKDPKLNKKKVSNITFCLSMPSGCKSSGRYVPKLL